MDHGAHVPHLVAFHRQDNIFTALQLHHMGEGPVFGGVSHLLHAFALHILDVDDEFSLGRGPSEVAFHYGDRVGFQGLRQGVGAQIQPARSPAPACENAFRAVGAHHQSMLVPRGIDGPSKVDGVAPLPDVVALTHPQIVAPTGGFAVAREVQRFSVGMEERRFVLCRGIDRGRQWDGCSPRSIVVLGGGEDVHGQVAVGVGRAFFSCRGKKQGLAISAQGRLSLPALGAVDVPFERGQMRPRVHRCAVEISVFNVVLRHKEVDVGRVARDWPVGGEDHRFVVH